MKWELIKQMLSTLVIYISSKQTKCKCFNRTLQSTRTSSGSFTVAPSTGICHSNNWI